MQDPEIDRACALFLDVDGTLIEIAETPDAVVVPPDLPPLLSRLRELLGGAVAIVSGRPIGETDRLLAPFVTASSGEHGAAVRHADGTLEEVCGDVSFPETWRETIERAIAAWPGVLLERKPHGGTMHYRLAPQRGAEVWQLARSIVRDDDPWFKLIPASMAVEIGLRCTTKAHAVEALMTRLPFRDRIPLFIGDDYTDEAGMRAASQMGGRGLRVAESFGGSPAEVRAWLKRGVERLARNGHAGNGNGAAP